MNSFYISQPTALRILPRQVLYAHKNDMDIEGDASLN